MNNLKGALGDMTNNSGLEKQSLEKQKLNNLSNFDEVDSLPLPDKTDAKSDGDAGFLTSVRRIEIDEDAFQGLTGRFDAPTQCLDAPAQKTQPSEETLFMAAFAFTLSKFSADSKVLFNDVYAPEFDFAQGGVEFDLTQGGVLEVRDKSHLVGIDFKGMETVEDALLAIENQGQNMTCNASIAEQDCGVKSDVFFAYRRGAQNHQADAKLEANRQPSAIDPHENSATEPIFCVEVRETGGGHEISCTYPSNHYSAGLVDNFLTSYENILSEFTVKTRLQDVETATRAQMKVLESFNTEAFCEDLGKKSVVSLFRECAKKHPDMTAVVFKDKSYTFEQLDEMTDKLAAVIYKKLRDKTEAQTAQTNEKAKEKGAAPLETSASEGFVHKTFLPVVSIIISRNENMVIAPLAVMKAGCAYQPLDPAYPKERLNFMVQDANALLIIEEPAYSGVLTCVDTEKLSTDDFSKIFQNGASLATAKDAKPEDAMVLLYTSGSTGTPKGVILEQRNVATWCCWYNNYFDLQAGDNIACYASFGFDAHMSDIYPALTGGKTVHIIPEEIRLDLIALNQYFMKNDVKSTLITTAVALQFVANIKKTSLKYLLTGGEKMPTLDPPADYTLINLYGPTETTITVTAKAVCDREENIPIGQGYETNKLYVVDQYMKCLPVGAPGELIVAGPQVGRGYLNRPDKTAQAFIKSPFSAEDCAQNCEQDFMQDCEQDFKQNCGQNYGQDCERDCKSDYEPGDFFTRAYRTGDIVRYRENGDIEFVGRRDMQVKIHGYRIELKEVEAVIREFAGITDATVQAFDDENGGKFIAAYICGNDAIDIEKLDAFIAAQKPSYMVPYVTMQIDKIPHNVNQKVDKNALPKPDLGAKSKAKKKASSGAATEGATTAGATMGDAADASTAQKGAGQTKAADAQAPSAPHGTPLNILETKLKSMLSDLFGTDDFDIDDELSTIGLTSINGIKLAAMLYNDYHISMNAFDLLDGATLQTIENEILESLMAGGDVDAGGAESDDAPPKDGARENGSAEGAAQGAAGSSASGENADAEGSAQDAAGGDGATKDAASVANSAPLNFSQQGVYSECLNSPDSTFYNLAYCLRIPSVVSIDELKAAVRALYNNHPALRSRITTDDSGNIVQADIQARFLAETQAGSQAAAQAAAHATTHADAPDFEPDLPVFNMSEKDFESHKENFTQPFDLETGPLSRFEIVRTNADGLYLLMDVHHLAADGASFDIMLSELCNLLDGQKLQPEIDSVYDFARKQKLNKENEDFFDDLMGGVEEASQLIPDVYEKGLPHKEGVVCVPTDIARVVDFAKKKGVTPASVYLTATFLTTARFTCEDQVSIATISSGRSNVGITNTVGMFVNTLPLASTIENDEACSEFIQRTAKLFTSVIRHENHPFAAIAAKYDFKPQISYAYQVGVTAHYITQRGEIELADLALDQAKLPLSIQIFGDAENEATIQINYDKALFSEAFARRFGRALELATKGLTKLETVGEVSLTNKDDWCVLDSYNQEMLLDFDATDSVVSKFRKISALYPDKTAAIYKDKSYTYRELDEATDRLAAVIYELMRKITGKENMAEEVVSVIISRSEYVFLLPLAILKSGCAYEPLDPSYPKDRLNFMVQDAGATLLIGDEDLTRAISEYKGEVLYLKDLERKAKKLETRPDAPDACQMIPAPEARDLMVMLYTSGTTGTPKGCQIEHGNMVAFAFGSAHEGFYTTDATVASFASFGFDVCMSDTFCALLNGATLCVIPEDVRMNLNELAAYFNEAHVTQVLLTTQVGVQFVANYPQMKTLRYLVMGGEKLPPLDPEKLNYTIINGYGPTENCCGVSLFPIRFWEPNIPIGKPLVTIAGFVLDKAGHRLPAGAAGELCVSGPQVTRGYLNRPDKTQEAYTACLFNNFRMYRTGDIVRYREDGDIEFVGRKDGQVKIRGFRVETKEVESVIREYPNITDATVQAYSFDGGGKYLAAFVVSDRQVDINDLNQFIKDRKPAYMVPLATMQLDKIPLTINQKVDKKALPKPEVKKAVYVAPANKAEEDFCTIFGEILDVEKVGAADDFFEIGGSSISAMRVVVAANQMGYEIVYQNVFENTTPKDLAAFAGGGAGGDVAVGGARGGSAGIGSAGGGTHGDAEDNARADARATGTDAETNSTAASFYGSGTSEVGPDGYDYKEINALLRSNTVEAFRSGTQQSIQDVLLCGATGYLGIHVLRELIDGKFGKIYCLVRAKKDQSGKKRLKALLKHYFGSNFAKLFGKRIFVIEGDATDTKTLARIQISCGKAHANASKNKNCQLPRNITVINCAASVKHFSRGNEIERANLDIVQNLIEWCLANKSRLVHVSTESVFGHPSHGVPRDGFIYDEHMLYVGQTYDDNQYVKSKFLAERQIYEAILQRNLNAKVLRAGNLAPRDADGAFQINAATNNYMKTLKGFKLLGAAPYEVAVQATEFSPIDKVAAALVKLSITPRECVCFMMSNNHRPLMGDVIDAMNSKGFDIQYVEGGEFATKLQEALKDPALIDAMSPFMAYDLNEKDEQIELGLESLSVSYTSEILARLGFKWPTCTAKYCKHFIAAMIDYWKK